MSAGAAPTNFPDSQAHRQNVPGWDCNLVRKLVSGNRPELAASHHCVICYSGKIIKPLCASFLIIPKVEIITG